MVHATRATRGYRNPSFSSQLQDVGVFSYTGSSSPILVPLYIRAVNGRVVQPKHGTGFSDIGIIFRTVQDWVLKVGIWAGFGSRTVGNARIFVANYFSKQFSGRVLGLLNG